MYDYRVGVCEWEVSAMPSYTTLLFLFLMNRDLDAMGLFAISSKVYSRINSNSLDLDTV